MPKRVRLLNNNATLPFEVTHLPFLNGFNETARIEGPSVLNIYNIPTDDFAAEPIVIEVEWEG